jgi:transposase InsO family protein
LDRIYYDPASGGAFGTAPKIQEEVRRRGYYRNVGLRRIQTYLNKQKAHTLYKPAKTRYPTPPVHVSAKNMQFDMDLMDVSRFASDNDGIRYLQTAIDVLSKYAYAVPIKDKEGRTVTVAASEIFDDRQPQQVCTDRGVEYKSHRFQQLLREREIRHFFAGGSGKCTVVERFHRSLRTRMARYQYKANSMRYIDVLQDLIAGYNKTHHRSIRMRPNEVTEENEHIAYRHLYLGRKTPKQIRFQFKVGDSVRITGEKHPFRREFFQRWSEEIFEVSRVWRQRNVNMYKIKDCTGEQLEGSFYASELSRVTSSPDDLYKVESYLDEKEENGAKWVKVK